MQWVEPVSETIRAVLSVLAAFGGELREADPDVCIERLSANVYFPSLAVADVARQELRTRCPWIYSGNEPIGRGAVTVKTCALLFEGECIGRQPGKCLLLTHA